MKFEYKILDFLLKKHHYSNKKVNIMSQYIKIKIIINNCITVN